MSRWFWALPEGGEGMERIHWTFVLCLRRAGFFCGSVFYPLLCFSDQKINPVVTYDQLFPLYAQPCALTQIKKTGKSAGGSPGHAVLYIKGMCRDKNAPYPRVEPCQKGIDLTDPNSGVLISVNKNFQNINWIAFEGKTLSFHGGIPPYAPINTETKNQAIQNAIESGAFRGVRLLDHWEKTRPQGMTLEESIARMGLATDYALDFGRKSYCNRIPISPAQLKDMSEYLNKLNAPFIQGKQAYHWNGVTNNCAHVVKNTLAAAGIRSAKSTEHFLLGGLLDPVVPSNLILTTAEKTILKTIPEVTEYYRNPKIYNTLVKYGNTPIPYGVIFETLPMHTQNNTLYELRDTLFTLDLPLLHPRKSKMAQLPSMPSHSDLETNLNIYREIYSEALKSLKPLKALIQENPELDEKGFSVFYDHYLNWLKNSLVDISGKIQLLKIKDSLKSNSFQGSIFYF